MRSVAPGSPSSFHFNLDSGSPYLAEDERIILWRLWGGGNLGSCLSRTGSPEPLHPTQPPALFLTPQLLLPGAECSTVSCRKLPSSPAGPGAGVGTVRVRVTASWGWQWQVCLVGDSAESLAHSSFRNRHQGAITWWWWGGGERGAGGDVAILGCALFSNLFFYYWLWFYFSLGIVKKCEIWDRDEFLQAHTTALFQLPVVPPIYRH